MRLSETTTMMCSDDYSVRFKAEYLQLVIRIQGLKSMLCAYRNDRLTIKPKCSYNLLALQLRYMNKYLTILEDSAIIENIDLETVSDGIGGYTHA